MSSGKLIVIEGTDGSGKKTQSELLLKNLKKEGIKASILGFPVYESFTGELVARYLRNDFGRISPYLAATLYAVNRFQFRDQITQKLKEGQIVVLNRYVTANQIHQAANAGNKKDRERFQKWVAELEYKIFQMPKPDLVLFISIPVEIAVQRVQLKSKKERKYALGSKEDLLESDMQHQREALKELIKFAKKNKNARTIDAVEKGNLLSKDEISKKMWTETKKFLRIKN